MAKRSLLVYRKDRCSTRMGCSETRSQMAAKSAEILWDRLQIDARKWFHHFPITWYKDGGVNCRLSSVIGADKRAENSPNWAMEEYSKYLAWRLPLHMALARASTGGRRGGHGGHGPPFGSERWGHTIFWPPPPLGQLANQQILSPTMAKDRALKG